MFLQLGHTKLDVYSIAQRLVTESYAVTNIFPSDEKFVLTQQIKRAALSVQLNIAEGSSRKSDAERKRFYEIARGSVIEIDAALDAAIALKYCSVEDLESLGNVLVQCFKYLSGLINSIKIDNS